VLNDNSHHIEFNDGTDAQGHNLFQVSLDLTIVDITEVTAEDTRRFLSTIAPREKKGVATNPKEPGTS